MENVPVILSEFPVSPQTLQIAAFIAGVLILTIHFRMRLQARAKREAAGTTAPDPSISFTASAVKTPSVSEVRAMANELNHLVVELHETSRLITVQIDNRVTKLNLLIVEADDKIKHLESLRAHALTTTPPTPPTLTPLPPPPPTGPTAPGSDPCHRTADLRTPTITPHFPLPSAQDAIQRQIYDLADEGHTPRQIAQTLHASPGEVELILNLRQQSK